MANATTQQPAQETVNLALAETHPELHHYTTLSGLEGILKTRTLWATHYRDLNDTTEVRLLSQPLVAAFEPRFREVIRTQQRRSFRIRRAVQEFGGLLRVSRDVADSFVHSLYQTTFEDDASFGLAAFVASFCTHTTSDHDYEREHGLLSQWRGYGGRGGYCLVLDTQALAELLYAEFSSYYYLHLDIDAVRYAARGTPIEQLLPVLPQLLMRGEQFLSAILERKDPTAVVEDACAPFISGATLYKHQSFREECEVRIVAMPGTAELQARMLREHPHVKAMPTKTVHRKNRRRYISLLDGSALDLPIRRIIVGPSRNQAANLDRARALVLGRISVVASEIPFSD